MFISQHISAVLQRIFQWNTRRIGRAQLLKLSDRELYDIGLHRGDIDNMA